MTDWRGPKGSVNIDLEAGHERAELGKTLSILSALGLSLHSTPAPPARTAVDQTHPLNAAWMPAESYRRIREPMKQLTMSETPPELAAMNVFIRERSLATA